MSKATEKQIKVVSYGMGLDSTAMIVEMFNRGEPAPDLILFSDTRAEKPETYQFLSVMNEWLSARDWPQVTVVAWKPVRAKYDSMEAGFIHTETMPSLAFGGHTCSLRNKKEVMDKYLRAWAPAMAAWDRDEKVQVCIGYDDSQADRKRRAKVEKSQAAMEEKIASGEPLTSFQKVTAKTLRQFENRYPLQDWNLERDELAEIIAAAGLPVPPKSACFFCPASQVGEVMELKANNPDLYRRAVAIEDTARDGRHGFKSDRIKGLGMGSWAWGWLSEAETVAEAVETIMSRGGTVRKALRP